MPASRRRKLRCPAPAAAAARPKSPAPACAGWRAPGTRAGSAARGCAGFVLGGGGARLGWKMWEVSDMGERGGLFIIADAPLQPSLSAPSARQVLVFLRVVKASAAIIPSGIALYVFFCPAPSRVVPWSARRAFLLAAAGGVAAPCAGAGGTWLLVQPAQAGARRNAGAVRRPAVPADAGAGPPKRAGA